VSRFLATLVTLIAFSGSAHAQATLSQDDVYAGLLGWAEKLSGYPAPATMPVVEFKPQSFFDANACGGHHCHVWGWYPDTGRNVVYVHEAARAAIADASDPQGVLAASIVVHEFTHYLQAVHRNFAPYPCSQAIALEREAYAVQNAYINAYGRMIPVGVAMQTASCGGNASAKPETLAPATTR
jgi:hypothetical protein